MKSPATETLSGIHRFQDNDRSGLINYYGRRLQYTFLVLPDSYCHLQCSIKLSLFKIKPSNVRLLDVETGFKCSIIPLLFIYLVEA